MMELILPIGTQVVLRRDARTGAGRLLAPAGSVGVVSGAPADASHAYRVRLPDGAELSLRRSELSIRKHLQAEALAELGGVLRDRALYDHVVLRVVVGSRAYGLDGDDSDVDRRGVYLPPAELHWSLYGVPEQLEDQETEECYWEIGKFLTLALKANPNILEVLYSPLVEHVAPLAEELIAERHRFLSRIVYQTYNGYVMSQFKRLEQDVRTAGTPRPKHAMHLVRLLISGITALREGHVPVRVERHREELLAIRHERMSWSEVNAWRLALHRDFEQALVETRLPERPDYAWANDFLVRARRSAVGSG
jgi:predicted nucleotidyltransferase